MNWFKHRTNEHTEHVIADAFGLFGHAAYKFYFILHEVYGKYYNERDYDDLLKISMKNLSKLNNINKNKAKKILEYYAKNSKITLKIEEEFVLYKINNFKKLHNRWQDNKYEEIKEKPTIEEEERKTENIENVEINYNEDAVEILDYLNYKTKKNYKDKRYIIPILKKGYKVKDFIKVIDNETNNEFFKNNKKFLTPKVIFKEEMFDIYLNEIELE